MLQAKEGAKSKEEDSADDDQRESISKGAFEFSVDDAADDDANPNKRWDQRPHKGPALPISGLVLIEEDGANACENCARDSQAARPGDHRPQEEQHA